MQDGAAEIQKAYYKATALEYDVMHLSGHVDVEHQFALHFLSSLISLFEIKSILDVGAGTGRTIEFIQRVHPNVGIVGIEPVRELREQGYKKGISQDALLDGSGLKIDFADKSFDLVCEFGVLHHVPTPKIMVAEMLRVAKTGIFISDSNNFGQGSFLSRSLKQLINYMGLWRAYNFMRTKGKHYQISQGDGLYYSYSVFNDYKFIKNRCKTVHMVNTKDGTHNFYRSASHVALFGLKAD
jgi:ubiquinone/menaquinone biosynthesis C-methylase UbiE